MAASALLLCLEVAQIYSNPQLKIASTVAQESDSLRASGRLRAAQCPKLPHEVWMLLKQQRQACY